MKSAKELLDKAKAGTISRAEVDAVIAELQTGKRKDDAYTLLHVLGVANAIHAIPVVLPYLEAAYDPMLASMALKCLCNHWGLGRSYLSQVHRFAEGVSWDPEGYVRLTAVSVLGEVLREQLEPQGLRILLDTLLDGEGNPVVRLAAYRALLRAEGRPWEAIPSPLDQIDLERDIDPGTLQWVKTQLRV